MTSPSSSLRLALLQVASSPQPAANLARLPELAERARDADLVVLPEVFARDFGSAGDPEARDAEPLDGPFVAGLVEAARRQGGTWVAGMFERSEDPDRPFNTLVAVDGHGLRATYRKIHLYDSFGYKESDRLAAADPVPTVVDVAGVQVGLTTCYDLRFPELSRALARAGTDLLLVPAAWVAGPRKMAQWRALLVARAIENVAYVAGVSQPGPRYTGHSTVVDPRGEIVASAEDGEAVVTATVDAALLQEARTENPSLLNRRDDVPWAAALRVGPRDPRSGDAGHA